jgi:hypothetical protein
MLQLGVSYEVKKRRLVLRRRLSVRLCDTVSASKRFVALLLNSVQNFAIEVCLASVVFLKIISVRVMLCLRRYIIMRY